MDLFTYLFCTLTEMAELEVDEGEYFELFAEFLFFLQKQNFNIDMLLQKPRLKIEAMQEASTETMCIDIRPQITCIYLVI